MMAGRAAERHGDARDDHCDSGERGQARTETADRPGARRGPPRYPQGGISRAGSGSGAVPHGGGIGLLGRGRARWVTGRRAPDPVQHLLRPGGVEAGRGSLRSRPSITGHSGPALATARVRRPPRRSGWRARRPARTAGGPRPPRTANTERPHVRSGARASAAGASGRKVGRRPEQNPRYVRAGLSAALAIPKSASTTRPSGPRGCHPSHVTMHHTGLVHGAEGGQDTQADPGRLGGAMGRLRPRHRAASGTARVP